MPAKPYYSIRHGKHSGELRIDLDTTKRLFIPVYRRFEQGGYFQEAFGYHCIDRDYVAGNVGQDMSGAMLLKLRKNDLSPVEERIGEYSEDDFFSVVEFLYDHTSLPTEGHFHSYYGCGMHWSEFDREKGRAEYRKAVNEILEPYDVGFFLSDDGEVLRAADTGLEPLYEAEIPSTDEGTVKDKMEYAIRKFRRHRASVEDRREAVRTLADVLEYLRPQVKNALATKDEGDLFNIANNFAVRHHNENQRSDYDPAIWLSWMFNFYLATLHAALRLIEREPVKGGKVIAGTPARGRRGSV